MPRTTAVVKAVEVDALMLGDKLLTDVIGYKGKTLIARGATISARELTWIRKKLQEGKPRLASQKYRTTTKALGDICDSKGKVLVPRGKEITEAALAPLLSKEEGFHVQEIFEANMKMFYKKAEWQGPYHIKDFNPIIQVERVELVNDDGSAAGSSKKEKVGAGA